MRNCRTVKAVSRTTKSEIEVIGCFAVHHVVESSLVKIGVTERVGKVFPRSIDRFI